MMKKCLLFLVTPFFYFLSISQNVGIGTTTPNSSAQLDISSTSAGLLPPRMSTLQRNAIINPAPGLIIFNITTQSLEVVGTGGWQTINFNQNSFKKLFGGTGAEFPKQMQLTPDGGCIVAGYTSSNNTGTLSGTINYGSQDGWILKVDIRGNVQWQKVLGGTGTFDQFHAIQITADGGYIVAGNTNSGNSGTLAGVSNNGSTDAWLIKLDGNGNTQWQKLYGGSSNDYFYSILQTADAGYVIAGGSYSSNGTLTGLVNNGAMDGWMMKTDANGNTQWQNLSGGNITDYFYTVQFANDGGYIASGGSSSTSNTGTLTGFINNGGTDGWVVKTDATGNTQWQKLFGGSGNDIINVMATASGTEYVFAGKSSSSNTGTININNNGLDDGWIFKTDNSGIIAWQLLWGGADNDGINSLLRPAAGELIASGYSSSPLTGTLNANPGFGFSDGWLVKCNSAGTIQWQQLLGGGNDDSFVGVGQANDGSLIIVGSSASPNNGKLTGIAGFGASDLWLFKADGYGNCY